MRERNAIARLFSELDAGGFTRFDPYVSYGVRVNTLLQPDHTVLELGAGRGAILDRPQTFARDLNILRGRCRWVIGVDLDPIVATNTTVDEAVVWSGSEPLPLDDASIDLVSSINVFEHIDDPTFLSRELSRVTRPGGWICAATASKWGYPAIGGRLVPNALHSSVLRRAQSGRSERDVFPTTYRLNTLSAVGKYFGDEFDNFSYYMAGNPGYNFGSVVAASVLHMYQAVVPGVLKKHLHVFFAEEGVGRLIAFCRLAIGATTQR